MALNNRDHQFRAFNVQERNELLRFRDALNLQFGGIDFNLQTGVAYGAILSDAGVMIGMNNAAPNTVTLPANSSVPFPLYTEISFVQLGAGATTIAITDDTLSVESALTLVLAGQYAVATAKKVAATQWVLFGNLTAA